jgi:RimJ/RimL family protein N-acetyltransferase
MSSSSRPTPLGGVARHFDCKNGNAIELRRLPAEGGQQLIEMYLAFQPRGSFQGLPPIKDQVCIKWVREMLATGVHVVAIDGPAGFIGHTALFPVNQQKCEMLVVVCPNYQNLGIGTELVRSCIALSEELGFERIWLPVDATNVRARHIYRKCGFEYVSNKQGRELDMVCHLRPANTVRTENAPMALPIVNLPLAPHSVAAVRV